MPRTKNDFEIKICRATLKLASTHGWDRVTLEQIAKAAKIPLAQFKSHFATQNDILPPIMRLVTSETAAAIGKLDRNASPHDRLFDVMMTRFEILQKHRKAILGIMDAARRGPEMLCALLPALNEAMKDMLALAGIDRDTLTGPLVTVGLKLVHMATLRVWQSDETIDMAKTMAALDRYLRYAGRVADICFHRV